MVGSATITLPKAQADRLTANGEKLGMDLRTYIAFLYLRTVHQNESEASDAARRMITEFDESQRGSPP